MTFKSCTIYSYTHYSNILRSTEYYQMAYHKKAMKEAEAQRKKEQEELKARMKEAEGNQYNRGEILNT